MVPLDLGPMPSAQAQSWHGLLDVAERVPTGWCLVGGQMVFLFARERSVPVPRTTTDVDAVLDVRAHRTIWPMVTQVMLDVGFVPAPDPSGRQVTWIRGQARLDLLVPRHLGSRWSARSAAGGFALETPGAQYVVNSAMPAEVVVDGRVGTIMRPSLAGAIGAKAAAVTVVLDVARDRHLVDLVVLATAMEPGDRVGQSWGRTERRRVANAVGLLTRRPDLVAQVVGGQRALELLTRIVNPA